MPFLVLSAAVKNKGAQRGRGGEHDASTGGHLSAKAVVCLVMLLFKVN